MNNANTDRLIQVALSGSDLFEAEPLPMAGDESSTEFVRAHIDSLLASLTPELRQAIRSGFGLDGELAEAEHEDRIGRALWQLRLERVMDDGASGLPETRKIQAA